MSRVFKPKAASSKLEMKKSEKLPVKVESRTRKLDLGVTLVEKTPEKPKVLSASLSAAGGSLAFGQPKFGLLPTNGNGKTVERVEPSLPPLAPANELEEEGDGDGEEEKWMMDSSSPDIVLLSTSSRGCVVDGEMDNDEQEEEEVAMMATPRAGRGRKRLRQTYSFVCHFLRIIIVMV